MNGKICPIMSAGLPDGYVECKKEKCQLWIQVYSTERIPFYVCAFEMMAMKNSEGLYRV